VPAAVGQAFRFELRLISKGIEWNAPGKNPKNGARPFTGEELAALRRASRYKNSRKETIDDTPAFLLLRWSGLRVSDAVQLQWKHVHFGRGTNGEIEILTQKRSKVAIVPLSSELRENLETLHSERKPSSEDRVLWNPETDVPYADRAILTRRAIALCERAGIKGSAHCFRDTFACDMLTRGIGIFEVAKMLADTVPRSSSRLPVTPCKARWTPDLASRNRLRLPLSVARRLLGFAVR
jgi:integrase